MEFNIDEISFLSFIVILWHNCFTLFLTCALETGCTVSTSSPTWGLYSRAFTTPLYTKYRTPGIVMDVSAMFVDKMTFRDPAGVS